VQDGVLGYVCREAWRQPVDSLWQPTYVCSAPGRSLSELCPIGVVLSLSGVTLALRRAARA